MSLSWEWFHAQIAQLKPEERSSSMFAARRNSLKPFFLWLLMIHVLSENHFCLTNIRLWGLPRTTLEMTKGAWHPNRTRWTREHLQPLQFMCFNSGVKCRQTSWWEQTMCGGSITTPETLWIEPIGKPTTTKSNWSRNTWFSADRLHSRKTALHTDTL